MSTWSVWTTVNGSSHPLGTTGGTPVLITEGLTEKQARDIMKYLRNGYGDWTITVKEG